MANSWLVCVLCCRWKTVPENYSDVLIRPPGAGGNENFIIIKGEKIKKDRKKSKLFKIQSPHPRLI